MTETISIRPLEIWKTAPDAPYSPDSTWYVLGKYQDGDLEMLVCWLITPEKPDGELATCYAWAVRDVRNPVPSNGTGLWSGGDFCPSIPQVHLTRLSQGRS